MPAVCCLQGTIKGHEHSYQLDDHHTFVTGKPMLVCGNTAAMVGEKGHSWLAKNFQVGLLTHTGMIALSLHRMTTHCRPSITSCFVLPGARTCGIGLVTFMSCNAGNRRQICALWFVPMCDWSFGKCCSSSGHGRCCRCLLCRSMLLNKLCVLSCEASAADCETGQVCLFRMCCLLLSCHLHS